MACETCPPSVIAVVANEVADMLNRVERIKYLTVNFNAAFLRMLTVIIADDLDAWIAAIPLPPLVDIAGMLDALLCPLTPLAYAIDPTVLNTLPFSQLYYQLTQDWDQEMRNVNAAYIRTTESLNSAFLIQFAQMYMRELFQAMGDPFEFPIRLALVEGYVTYVSQVCPELYKNRSYPFMAFTDAMTTFTFTGMLPNGLDPSVQPILDKVVEAEMRILGWTTLMTVKV